MYICIMVYKTVYLMDVLLCLLSVFHVKSRLSSIVPENCLLIVVGVVMGLMLFAAGETGFTLNTVTFFLILLPWIVLNAGYTLPLRAFFDNIGTIVTFAVIGTLWNTFAIGLTLWGFGKVGMIVQLAMMHTLVFASLLAAVDPVTILSIFANVHTKELLCAVVLGESLLNDGMAVVSITL